MQNVSSPIHETIKNQIQSNGVFGQSCLSFRPSTGTIYSKRAYPEIHVITYPHHHLTMLAPFQNRPYQPTAPSIRLLDLVL